MGIRAWDNTPVFDDFRAWKKLQIEKGDIKLHFPASNIKMILNLNAESTGEVHAFPIFNSDTFEDLCNRYGDLFPLELKQTIKEVESINQTLYNPDGMSKEKLNMAKLKMPLTLYTILSTYDPDFWLNLDAGKIKKMEGYFSKFKIGK